MKIHEYQAKAVLSKYGVPVPRGEVAFTPEEVHDIAKRLGGPISVVKAQIHAGGRGKAGGVKLAKSGSKPRRSRASCSARRWSRIRPVPSGQKVSRLLVEEGLAIDRELYLGLVLDRSSKRIVLMVSKEGGVEIEKIAEEHPEKIHKVFINPAVGLQAVRGAEARLRARLERRFAQEGRQDDAGALQRLHRDRRVDPRDQSADRHQERRPARARREDELRRQRALSPRRHPRAARHRRRGSARSRSLEVLAQLHPPRRHDRLHGQRRRPGDGDDGHHQAVGR